MRFVLSAVVCLLMAWALVTLSGCSASQAAAAGQVIETVQQDVALSLEALQAADVIVNAAAPGSKTAANLTKITTTATKVNGVVSNLQITIPVTPAVPAVAPAAPAVSQ